MKPKGVPVVAKVKPEICTDPIEGYLLREGPHGIWLKLPKNQSFLGRLLTRAGYPQPADFHEEVEFFLPYDSVVWICRRAEKDPPVADREAPPMPPADDQTS